MLDSVPQIPPERNTSVPGWQECIMLSSCFFTPFQIHSVHIEWHGLEVSEGSLQVEVLCPKLVYLDTECPCKVAAIPALCPLPLGGKSYTSC